jgi:hypothetical protein
MTVDRVAVGDGDGLPRHFIHIYMQYNFASRKFVWLPPPPQISFPLFVLHIRFSDHEKVYEKKKQRNKFKFQYTAYFIHYKTEMLHLTQQFCFVFRWSLVRYSTPDWLFYRRLWWVFPVMSHKWLISILQRDTTVSMGMGQARYIPPWILQKKLKLKKGNI